MATFSLRSLFYLLLLASVGYGRNIRRSVEGANAGPDATPNATLIQPRIAPPHDVHHDVPVNAVPNFDAPDQITCTNDNDCTSKMGPDAICHGIHCTCNDESYYSQNVHKCLREITNLGSGCEEDMQCKRRLGDAVRCDGHYCKCVPTASVVDGKCWIQKRIGESCQRSEECMGGDHSSCLTSTCQCNTGFVNDPSNTKCLKKAHNVNDDCEEAIQCTENLGDGSKCQDSKCICLDGYRFKNSVCMKTLILGERCGTNIEGECFLKESFGIDHVECKDVCICKGDRVPSSDNQKCLEKGSEDDGHGGAGSLQPVFITIATVTLARIFSS